MENGSDLSQRVLRAAKGLFFTRGFANAQLRAIASEAGTSESGVLRVYGSKKGLLLAVYTACWTDLNARVEGAVAQARAADPDPRHVLLELARAVWNYYQSDPEVMSFLIGHFGHGDTRGLAAPEGVDPEIIAGVRRQYDLYLGRIHDLCDLLVEQQPHLGDLGVTADALGHFIASILYGIQTSWHMAEQEREAVGRADITIDQALAALRFFLYREAPVIEGAPAVAPSM